MNQPWVDDLEEASDYESEEDWSDDRKRSERFFLSIQNIYKPFSERDLDRESQLRRT